MTTYLDLLPDDLYIKIYEDVNRSTLKDAAKIGLRIEMRTLPKRDVSMKCGLAEPRKPNHVSITWSVDFAFTRTPAASAVAISCADPLPAAVSLLLCAICR